MTTTRARPGPRVARKELTQLLAALSHEDRLRLMRWACRREEFSPKDAAPALDIELPLVSYHVRALRDAGALKKTRTRKVRAAVQTFYVPTRPACELLAALDMAFTPEDLAILNSLVTFALENLPLVADDERAVAQKLGRAVLGADE